LDPFQFRSESAGKAQTCGPNVRHLLDDVSELLEVVARLVHLGVVEQHQGAHGQVELGRVLEDALVHPAILQGSTSNGSMFDVVMMLLLLLLSLISRL